MKQESEIWETYSSCWSESDSNKRINSLSNILSEDFQYKDPNGELKGHDNLSNYMMEFLYIHHDSIMANWYMINSNKEVDANGVDVAYILNGRLKQITGLFTES